MGLTLIGVGWGRTGTMSTRAALERLGLGRCHHMIEVFDADAGHRSRWRAAARGEPVDWDGLYAGYDAAVDWPTCAFWRELLDVYPDAKVLLTERGAESWYESFDATIRAGIPVEHPGEDDDVAALLHEIVVGRSFGGRVGTRDELLAAYRAHVDEVRATVPADRLLVWSVAEGWPRLCAFLGVEEPQEPFPHINDREEFGRIFGGDDRAGS